MENQTQSQSVCCPSCHGRLNPVMPKGVPEFAGQWGCDCGVRLGKDMSGRWWKWVKQEIKNEK